MKNTCNKNNILETLLPMHQDLLESFDQTRTSCIIEVHEATQNHIRAIWSECSLGAFWIAKDAKSLYANNQDWSECADADRDQGFTLHPNARRTRGRQCICQPTETLLVAISSRIQFLFLSTNYTGLEQIPAVITDFQLLRSTAATTVTVPTSVFVTPLITYMAYGSIEAFK